MITNYGKDVLNQYDSLCIVLEKVANKKNELLQCIEKYESTALPKNACVYYGESQIGTNSEVPQKGTKLNDAKNEPQDQNILGDRIATYILTSVSKEKYLGVFSDYAFYDACNEKINHQIVYSDISKIKPSDNYTFKIYLENKSGDKTEIMLPGINKTRRDGFCKMMMELAEICKSATQPVDADNKPDNNTEKVIYQESTPKDDSGMKINIVKNNYSSGSLEFQIFNPEESKFDDVNALADQNLLLRYTEEKRTVAEYADELIKTIFVTYRRMEKINIQYKGEYSDYEALANAINRVKEQTWYNSQYENCSCNIIGNCDMDPKEIRKIINESISEINKARKEPLLIEAMDTFNSEFGNKINGIDNISEIEETSDAKTLLEESECVLCFLNKMLVIINSFLSENKSEIERINNYLKYFNQKIKNRISKEVENLYAAVAWKCKAEDAEKMLENKLMSASYDKERIYSSVEQKMKKKIQDDLKKVCNEITEKSLEVYEEQWIEHVDNIKTNLDELIGTQIEAWPPQFKKKKWEDKIKNEIKKILHMNKDNEDCFLNEMPRDKKNDNLKCWGVSWDKGKQSASVCWRDFYSIEFLTRQRKKKIKCEFENSFDSLKNEFCKEFESAICDTLTETLGIYREKVEKECRKCEDVQSLFVEFKDQLQKGYDKISKVINGVKEGTFKLNENVPADDSSHEGGSEE